MYICVCKGITHQELHQAILAGLCTRKQLFECYGVGGQCGKCNQRIRHMISHAAPGQGLQASNCATQTCAMAAHREASAA